jgi:hypothetical protein
MWHDNHSKSMVDGEWFLLLLMDFIKFKTITMTIIVRQIAQMLLVNTEL